MHKCVAVGCVIDVPADRLMCNRHWRKVPHDIQRRVWAHYQHGQTAASATAEWTKAAAEAVDAVRRLEGK